MYIPLVKLISKIPNMKTTLTLSITLIIQLMTHPTLFSRTNLIIYSKMDSEYDTDLSILDHIKTKLFWSEYETETVVNNQ